MRVSVATISEQVTKLERVGATGRAADLAAHLAETRQSSLDTPAGNATALEPPRARRVLVADDHHINHLTIQAMLEDRDIEIVTAFDGAEALRKFKAGDFDCVLMDINMPVMDGISAVRAIRAHEIVCGSARTSIAMYTALSGREIEGEAHDAGADAYLIKPITLNQLYAFVDPAIQAR